VLIDVTLVEIRKSDDFNYDLNLITSLPDLVETGGQTGSFFTDGQRAVDELLASGTRSQFADFQANSGAATGFYADVHVNALLQAMQKKNYGRVLAKPKVLVNDNEKGTIKTTDTTYVTKRSSIPVTSGTAEQPDRNRRGLPAVRCRHHPGDHAPHQRRRSAAARNEPLAFGFRGGYRGEAPGRDEQ